ncbi:hypothetical protein Syun_006631 [Stephania yunnanensis]|uniref:Digalactosyldiacylglycerol synthase n=1 Tax=Stephania yunnanensis TaxID=152371 RepID=A0AAP0KZK2_9MAGN
MASNGDGEYDGTMEMTKCSRAVNEWPSFPQIVPCAGKFSKNKEEWRLSSRGIKLGRSNTRVHHLGETSISENDNVNDELDLRIASVLRSTGHCYDGGMWTDSVKNNSSDGKRNVAIVTTASLPWMTEPFVNPLFRATYLAKSAKQNVTLLVPWLCKSDQELVYPNNLTFSTPEEQESYIRKWLEERLDFKADRSIYV